MIRLDAMKEAVGKRRAALVGLVVLCFSLTPNIARAGVTEDQSGLYLGLGLAGTSFHADISSPAFTIKEDGGGVQISVGYRFNPVFMLEIATGGTNHETSDSAIDAGIASIQLFGYYRFLPEHSFRPYLKGGLAGYALTLKYGSASARVSGGGIAFGAGFRCFLSPRFSLGVDVTHNMIRYDKARLSLGQLSYESSIDEHARLTTLGMILGYSF